MESTSLLYYTERNCNVTQVGPLIDHRNYAIGMRKGYKYYHVLSEAVLKLQETGVLDKLHTIWWKSKRGGGQCQVCIRSVRYIQSQMKFRKFHFHDFIEKRDNGRKKFGHRSSVGNFPNSHVWKFMCSSDRYSRCDQINPAQGTKSKGISNAY